MNNCEDEVVIEIQPSDPIQVIQLEPSEDLSQMGVVDQCPSFSILVKEPDSANVLCCNTSTGGSSELVIEYLSARVLKVSLIASENISALKLIYPTSSSSGGLADFQNSSKKDAVGIALSSATMGNLFDVLLFGRVEDPFFNFPLNDSLFLGNNGILTNIAPTTDFSVRVGKSLGSGAIFINIERPIIL